MRKFLLLTLLILFLSSCFPMVSIKDENSVYIFNNETSTPLILALELSYNTDYENREISLYLETNNLNRRSEKNLGEIFGRDRVGLMRAVLFNLQDTTSIVWSQGEVQLGMWGLLERVIVSREPTREVSREDSLMWKVSHRAWHQRWRVEGERNRKWRELTRTLTATNELLEIMQKDYSMLQRFPEFYE